MGIALGLGNTFRGIAAIALGRLNFFSHRPSDTGGYEVTLLLFFLCCNYNLNILGEKEGGKS